MHTPVFKPFVTADREHTTLSIDEEFYMVVSSGHIGSCLVINESPFDYDIRLVKGTVTEVVAQLMAGDSIVEW